MPSRPRENRFAASLGHLAGNPWTILAVAAGVRLVVGLALLGTYGEAFPRASDDGDSYDAAARWLVSGDAIIHGRFGDSLLETSPDPAARWPSGYWLFLAGLYRLFGHQFAPPIILQASLAGAGIAAFYALATRVLPRRSSGLPACPDAIRRA